MSHSVNLFDYKLDVKDIARLIRALFTLSLQGDTLGHTANHALMLIGALEPKQFIITLGYEIHREGGARIPNNHVSEVGVYFRPMPHFFRYSTVRSESGYRNRPKSLP